MCHTTKSLALRGLLFSCLGSTQLISDMPSTLIRLKWVEFESEWVGFEWCSAAFSVLWTTEGDC